MEKTKFVRRTELDPVLVRLVLGPEDKPINAEFPASALQCDAGDRIEMKLQGQDSEGLSYKVALVFPKTSARELQRWLTFEAHLRPDAEQEAQQ